MDSQTLEQLQNDIEQKLSESLKNADLQTVLEKYGILEDRVLKVQWQCNLDLNKINSSDAVDKQQPNQLLQATAGRIEAEIVLAKKAWCVPCPATGDPYGCYC
ncbi:MAG: hypothetical protein RMY29_014370 [Nostoc sp. CreGUA01]|nr:hypothetical protein [Nostoc sp. CreGUA01]